MAAQSAVHLATSNIDKPSIFELVASSSLDSTFHPALKKIATVSFIVYKYPVKCLLPTYFQYLATLNPERYQPLIKYYDEIFLVLNAIVQNYYLRKNGNIVICIQVHLLKKQVYNVATFFKAHRFRNHFMDSHDTI